jgi:hypothetical protein
MEKPYPKRLLFVDEALYNWKFAEAHAAACFYCGRKEEAKESFLQILKMSKENPQSFSVDDLKKKQTHSFS